MCVMVPHVRVSMRERHCISRDSPKSATLAVMPCGALCACACDIVSLCDHCQKLVALTCSLALQACAIAGVLSAVSDTWPGAI